jgi:hypothetical protein
MVVSKISHQLVILQSHVKIALYDGHPSKMLLIILLLNFGLHLLGASLQCLIAIYFVTSPSKSVVIDIIVHALYGHAS